MRGFAIEKAGLFTLIQDRGRCQYTHLGVSPSGVLDEYAAFWAHKLLDNDISLNLLEITFAGVVLTSTIDTNIAITGAFCEFFINNALKQGWRSYCIKAGDTLRIGKFLKGSRVYLAIKNGFDIPKEFGSCSTSLKESLGGLNGDRIKNGDFLSAAPSCSLRARRVKEALLPFYEDELTLRVILSYQHRRFSKQAKERFFSSSFEVKSDSNRMACKLDGGVIPSSGGFISEGVGFGSIQIPSDGQPIILLKDRQTIGGYPKIGSVLPMDCFRLAQAKVGAKVKFKAISLQEAQKKLRDFYTLFL